MNTRKPNIKDDVRLRLQKIRKTLAGITLDDEEMSKVTGGCGGICYISCSFYCEISCEASCMYSSMWIDGYGVGVFCAMLPPQNGRNWERIIHAK